MKNLVYSMKTKVACYSLIVMCCLALIYYLCRPSVTTGDISLLSVAIQGKSPDKIREVIGEFFGNNSRHTGSGIDIEKWDIAGGVLTYHPWTGVTFLKNGVTTRLLRTSNPLAECLFGSSSFEMTTLPDPNSHGNCNYIGNLSLTVDGKYQFEESSLADESQQNIFFFIHPTGTATVNYAEGITAKTELESMLDNIIVATIEFTSDSDNTTRRYSIETRDDAMTLIFTSALPLSFSMNSGRNVFWNDNYARPDN